MAQKFIDYLEKIAPQIIGSIVVFVVGIVIIKLLMNILKRAFLKSKLDPICHKFILSILRITLYFILIIVVISILGVPVTSFVALLSVAGLAISLAIQGSLANIAGGFILLLTKPFKVGDLIELEGVSGTVKHINILQTKLLTFDNKAIFIPNGQVAEAKIINFSSQDTRRLDLVFSIGYQDDFKKAESIINEILHEHNLALVNPSPIVRVCELSSSSVDIAVRVWVDTQEYWNLNFDLLEMIKLAFDKNNISIPFNQLDINLNQ